VVTPILTEEGLSGNGTREPWTKANTSDVGKCLTVPAYWATPERG
jgi:hypothetical protein